MEQLIIGVFEQGFIYAVMALGVYITYKILDFPDLSVDSTFPLGAAITTVLLMNGFNPVLSLILSTAAGAAAGALTGIIHVKFRVRDLLSGIIMMTGLYTINLRITGEVPMCLCSTIIRFLTMILSTNYVRRRLSRIRH